MSTKPAQARPAPSADLVAALRAYNAMPGARSRCTHNEDMAARAAFAAIKVAAAAEGVSVGRVGNCI